MIYLHNISRGERSVLAQLRLGILPINIEIGRYKNQPINERLCPFCPDQIEDEFHFLFVCVNNELLRKDWTTAIKDKKPDIEYMDYSKQLEAIFYHCFRTTAKFLSKSLRLRKDQISKN